jgi:putative alpha-1,2-mannosidase
VDYEVRAGLLSVYNVLGKGWVADDLHSESASRTLDYACMFSSILFFACFNWGCPVDDDYAAYKLGVALGKPDNVTSFLLERAMRAPFTLFNEQTGFMEARHANGSWAGEDQGWTEGWLHSL